jgi:arylsulfatase A-like enzyme
MKKAIWTFVAGIFLLASCKEPKQETEVVSATEKTGSTVDRTILPLPIPAYKGKIDSFYNTSTPDWSQVLAPQAPQGAPNVLLIVLDDVGYGQLGCYGGPIETPNIDALANTGLKYTNFHTTALCSPTRGALLTGRNHHAVGLAAITEAATGYPGNFGSIPKSAAFIPEVLKHNGYNTMAIGKWHLAPYTSYTAAGPFDRWPLGMGFEKFYGFIGGETDQWAPLLVQDNQFLEIPTKEGYHLSEDLVDKTIAYIADQQQANTGRPFFTYLALGAAHAPLHSPKANMEKYKGRFDKGWDEVRRETFEKQKSMGIIPANSVLPERNPGVQAWDELNDTQKKVYTRLQETFAGFLDHADAQIGRLMQSLDELGIRENTLVIVVSDNGASQEGLQHGTVSTDRYRNYNPDTPEEMIKYLDKIGSEESDPHYPIGWAMAGNSPFKRWKQDTHAGGNTDPFIVNWPAKIKSPGMRTQYHHVVDVVPTILEAASLPAPKMVNGIEQQSMHGVSMQYSFGDAQSASTHKVQYYEMFGSRAIYAEGWKAVTYHRKGDNYNQEQWELYKVDEDFTESKNLAAQNPDKVKELVNLWWKEAEKYNVLPLDDRRYERTADPSRPVASLTKDVYSYFPGTSVIHPLTMPNLMSQNHTINAYANIPAKGAQGVLACSGSEFGGWSLFIQGNKLHYTHKYLNINEYHVSSGISTTPGDHKFTVHYAMKEKSEKPDFFKGDVDIYIDDKLVGSMKDVMMAGQYSNVMGYGLLVGRNTGTPISHLYKVPFAYTGKIKKVTIELK